MASRSDGSPVREFNWTGCFIVLFSVTSNFVWGGVCKSLGVLLPTLRDQFTTHTWMIGIMVSAMSIMADVTGLFVVLLENAFGTRPVLIFSVVMMSVGLLLVPLASSFAHIFFILLVGVGPGMGVMNVLNRVLIGRHFARHYSLACGFGHTGVALALVVFAPMVQLFLDTYGWRGAMLLMGGICFHAVASAASIRDIKPQYHPLPDDPGQSQSTKESGGTLATLKAIFIRLSKASDLGILLDVKFFVMYMSLFGVSITYNAWIVYYVPHLQAKGISPHVAAVLCSVAAVGYFFGTVVWAPFIERGVVKCSSGIIVSNLALTLSFVVDPWVNDILGQAVLTVIWGLTTGALYTLNETLIKDIFGSDRLASAFGKLQFLFCLPRLMAGFLPGWMYDSSGSYDLAFIVIGLTQTVTLLPLVIGKIWKGL